MFCPPLSVQRTVRAYIFDLATQSRDTGANESPVGFQLRLARAACTDTAAETLEVRPLTGKSGQEVFELR